MLCCARVLYFKSMNRSQPVPVVAPPAPEDADPRETLRRQCLAETPSWYNPWVHLAFPSLVGLSVVVVCALVLRDLHAAQLLTIPIVFVLANAMEWRTHKYVLHRRTFYAKVLYDRHTPIHHRLFVTH